VKNECIINVINVYSGPKGIMQIALNLNAFHIKCSVWWLPTDFPHEGSVQHCINSPTLLNLVVSILKMLEWFRW